MTKALKTTAFALSGIILSYGIVGFAISDPNPDFNIDTLTMDDQIALSQIDSKYHYQGSFKAVVDFVPLSIRNHETSFNGMEINITDNDQMDRIRVGVTNNLISRMEIWKGDKLIEIREIGFVGKMTQGEMHNLGVAFYSPNEQKPNRNATLQMRLYKGTGFLGDIGTLTADLSKYGNLNGEKSIQVFSKELVNDDVQNPRFSNLRIWKNFESAD